MKSFMCIQNQKLVAAASLASLLLLVGCDEPPDKPPAVDNPSSSNKPPSAAGNTRNYSNNNNDDDAMRIFSASRPSTVPPGTPSQSQVPVVEAPAISPEEKYKQFMAADEDSRQEMVYSFESSGTDVSVIARLMKEDVSSDVKQSLLDVLKDGEHDDIDGVLRDALRDTDPDVVSKAIEILEMTGTPDDIPALEALAAKTTNDDVREAANSAIESLRPN